MNILVLSAGRRDQLVSYFQELVEVKEVHCCDMSKYAPSLQRADYFHIVPGIQEPNYVDTLIEICSRHKINGIFSLNDFELRLLAKNKSKFAAIGSTVICSDKEVIEYCWDKYASHEFLKENGFDVPKQFSNIREIQENDLPIIIKPRFGTGSIGVEVIKNIRNVSLYHDYIKSKVSESSIARHENFGGDLIIEEKIDGVEYAVDIINDLNKNYVGCVVKRKISVRNGDASVVVTEHNKRIEEWAKRLSKTLRHIGNLDTDLILTKKSIYCVDLNPRFGGAFPFSYLSGVNLPLMIVDWLNKKDSKQIEYESGVVTARTESYFVLDKAV